LSFQSVFVCSGIQQRMGSSMYRALQYIFKEFFCSASRRRRLAFVLTLPLTIGLSLSTPCHADWINNGTSGGKPVDAIVGGWDQSVGYDNVTTVFYLCRAYHGNDLQPGYVPPGDSVCHFSYGGEEMTSANFDWYVPSWEYSYGQAMPANAIPFGGEPVGGGDAYRYPCRVNLTPGKYGQDFGACYFPYGGAEYHQPNSGFSWLVDPGNNINPLPAATFAQVGLPPDTLMGPYIMVDLGVSTDLGHDAWPPDAVVAGLDGDGTPLYFCTGYFQDGMQPGKARRDWDACDVSWGGSEHYIGQTNGEFVVLTPGYLGSTGATFFCTNYIVPCQVATNPIPVGTDSDGATLYACRAYTDDGLFIPGKTKVGMGDKACSYARNGLEIYSTASNNTILTDGTIPGPGLQ
jgi:hypothetical protein